MTSAVAFNPLTPDYQQNPYDYYRTMRQESPVYYIEPLNLWALFRYDDVITTVKRPDLFSSKDWIANTLGEFDVVPEVPSLISMDPPDHTRLRKLANKAFLPGVIRKMEDGIRRLISELLDEVQDKDEFDFVNDFAAHVPVNVTAQILGADPEIARNEFKRWTMDLLQAPNRTVLPQEDLDRIRTSVNELRAYFTDLIAYRRKNPSNDLVSALVEAEEDRQALTSDEILSLVFLLQFGGSETPSHLISSALYECFQNPEALAAVKSDPAATAKVIDEAFRHMSPVHFLSRTTTQDIEMHGITIPANSIVLSYIGSANRDETIFDDPDKFDINRQGVSKHLALGLGTHYCIGALLGKMMCGTALGAALERMPNLRPVHDTVEWMPSWWVRGLAKYPVRP
ncbi:cytochrome P450 [Saccharopolyspora sp. TS4A08]|uniref:Cytochrome P450 n=1 Tax=Saccharopolyspora ipomoeae TaxID=3042027 RepID=A0ABT6PUY2_9PSEU|nr:cytochrome P450 [Saccharopolyspora sp. TS4A08]MDI2031761.1 cytochrome P450 [Saccharopolyspora sp. TS4A08]